jgi:hypothetical protein
VAGWHTSPGTLGCRRLLPVRQLQFPSPFKDRVARDANGSAMPWGFDPTRPEDHQPASRRQQAAPHAQPPSRQSLARERARRLRRIAFQCGHEKQSKPPWRPPIVAARAAQAHCGNCPEEAASFPELREAVRRRLLANPNNGHSHGPCRPRPAVV